LSSTYPYVTASISAGCVLFAADVSAQLLTNTTSVWDHKRTLSLSIFGFVYYGGPCKALYFLYDKVFSPKQFMMKAMIDCCVHTPFLLVPCFYYITGILKGDNVDNITSQLRKEWFVASTGSVAFWLPMQLICFRFVRLFSLSLCLTQQENHDSTKTFRYPNTAAFYTSHAAHSFTKHGSHIYLIVNAKENFSKNQLNKY
jgi:hypothetical protein